MAGLFGFGNYTKEGPGIRKNGPQKKRFFEFWEIYFSKFWKLIALNILYLIFCIPIITIGPATAGFTYVLRNFAKKTPTFIWGDFWGAFKQNWKQSALLSLFNIIFIAIAGFGLFFYYKNATNPNISSHVFFFIGLIICLSAVLIWLFMNYYIHVLMVTFDYSMKQLIKNSFIFASAGLWNNLLTTIFILLVCGVVLGIFLLESQFLSLPILYLLFIFLLFFSTCGLIVNFNVFPRIKKLIIDPYYKEHNLPNPEEPESRNTEDSVFSDETPSSDI